MEQSNIKTGFTELDEKIDGFEKSDLICIASSPIEEKRNLAFNLICNITKQQIPILIFSLENNKDTISERILNTIFAINKIDDNEVYSQERHNEDMRYAILAEENTYIYDNILDISGIEQTSQRVKSQKNIGLIIIDYFQLVKCDETFEAVTIRLKLLAKELNVPIIILSQLSNELESREDKRPTLSDFQGSSSIVNYADTILFVYKDDYYNMDSEKKGLVDITVAKSKTGNTGIIDLLDIRTRYVNLQR